MTRLNICTLTLGLLLVPGWVLAAPDLDVTMRMVMDEEALDTSFVQEMEIPDSLNELPFGDKLDTLDASELADEARTLEESLSFQARETRDALELELPGEPIGEQPGLELPELPDPDGSLPITDPPTLPELPVPQ
ncbi:hypothetical protein [Marinobacter sp. X15-166B]|uniref:hypothetical protein n=1 Tax=Marinobacter sp. X15-166B TaxID=1897620 RepID=UPI00085CC7F7|nr:hypothetical protein [Marinobacter sp. X15-166B]OEY66373.1 hypothetical protein BG841_07810 [Marinobacter sp. X15-166B]